MNSNKKFLLLGLVAVPWLILSGMVAKAYLPIFTGKSYLLPVTVRDPRDFFRGNYVALRYDFSQLELQKMVHDLSTDRLYQYGDVLYLAFTESDGVLKSTGLFLQKRPGDRIVLRVTPEAPFRSQEAVVSLVAGLESYFAPAADALEWEDALRQGRVVARVAIDRNGHARLTGLELAGAQPARTADADADE